MISELHDVELKDLELKANEARQLVIKSLTESRSGHSAGPLGMADIFTALYFHILKHDPRKPDWPDRDRLVLSNGHICPILYVSMAQAGYFPLAELDTLRKINSRLQGHPHRGTLPGIETTSGPLGEGVSQAIGIALAGRLDHKTYHVYCLTSDGEQQEGNTWEAAMLAGSLGLASLTQIIDRNNIQIDGTTEQIMPLDSLVEKYRAFNWEVLEVDGNNIRAFIDVVGEARAVHEKPSVIIAHTVPGFGVSYMENNYLWHGNPPGLADIAGAPPKSEQSKVALDELRASHRKIESEHA
ncbi:MAG: transketolase [Chloroflexota bacterium]|nr:MAG: transketolase [Chloroflexota bacterium]